MPPVTTPDPTAAPVTPDTTASATPTGSPDIGSTPDAEKIIEQIIELMMQLSTEDQINLLGVLNGQFNVASQEAKNTPEAQNARAAEMANVF